LVRQEGTPKNANYLRERLGFGCRPVVSLKKDAAELDATISRQERVANGQEV
jgi:hypothetical protein